MKTIFLTVAAVSMASGLAFAQQMVASQPLPLPMQGGHNLAGNRLSELQAKDRLAIDGYTKISALNLDPNNVWRGTASKNGWVVLVGVDTVGNVFQQ